MQTNAYRQKRIFSWRDNDLFLLFILSLCTLVTALVQSLPLLSGELQEVADRVRKGVVLLFGLLPAVAWFYLATRRNVLQFDEDGLTYTRFGRRGAWSWRDISALTLVRRWYGPRIEFTVKWDDGRWRTAPLRRTKGGLSGAIPDIWDTPLKDIAATLNQYRGRAAVGDTAGAA